MQKQLGNYHNLQLLGRGGLADVFLGEHIYLRSKAAIKVLRADLTDTNALLEEARIAVELIHPNIVRILDYGIEDATPYIVMAHAPRGSIHAYYPVGSRLPFKRICNYVKQVASAVQYIHNKGLIHGDIKSENLLLGPQKEVWLSDFGITTSIYSYSPTMATWGTVSHMAPELLRQPSRPCFASDQYALAVVIYEWLCGELPFIGTKEEIVRQHLFSQPPSLCAKLPDIPEAVEDVVFKALSKNPYERFESVQDFADALCDAFVEAFVEAFVPQSVQKRSESLTPTIQVVLPDDRCRAGSVATLVAPVPTSTSGSAPSIERRRAQRVHPRIHWRKMCQYLTVNALVAIAVACLLTIFAVSPTLSVCLITASLLLVPLITARLYNNRSLLYVTCCMAGVSMAVALFSHSLIAFIITFAGLLLLSILITFTVSIGDFM